MDHSPVRTTQPLDEEDEWDTDGFVIPSLVIEDQDKSNHDAPTIEASKPPSPKVVFFSAGQRRREDLLRTARGSPSQSKQQQEVNPSSRKQKFKQKLKEADRRSTGTGRENKVENLRELVGGGKGSSSMAKDSNRDWLDPHCHESQFEKWNNQ